MSNTSTATSVAKINNVNIVVIENGEKRVAIKPICEALGLNVEAQRQKLKEDEILNSVTLLSKATGSDGKTYEMVTIPFRFVFGWLFTINPKNVAVTSRDAVLKYRLECYNALYDYFTGASVFLEEKEKMMEEMTRRVKSAKKTFSGAREFLYAEQEELYRIAHVTYEEYQKNGQQLSFAFISEGGTKD